VFPERQRGDLTGAEWDSLPEVGAISAAA